MFEQKRWSKRQEQFKGSSSAGAQTARRRHETSSVRKQDRGAAIAKRRLLAPVPGTESASAMATSEFGSTAAAAGEAFTAEMALAESAAAVKVLLAPPNEAELLAAVRFS